MSQQSNVTFRVSGDEPAPQGVPWSLEEYLKGDGTVVDRLLNGKTDNSNPLSKLQAQLDKLSGTVAGTNAQDGRKQA